MLHLTGKGSILDALGGVANTVGNAAISSVRDVGDLGSFVAGAVTGNQQAQQNAITALQNNNANINSGSVRPNLTALGSDLTNNNANLATQVLSPLNSAIGGFGRSVLDVGSVVPNEIKSIYDMTLGNDPTAGQNAFNQAGKSLKNLKQFAQFVPRAVVQTGESIVNPNATLPAAKTTVGKAILGDQPIPSIENVYRQSKQQGESTARALSTAGVTAATDVLAGTGAVKGGVKIASKIGDNTVPLDEAGGINNPRPIPAPEGAPSPEDVNSITPGKVRVASTKITSPISGREVDPQALADMSPAEQMAYARNNPDTLPTFRGPSLKLKSQQPDAQINLKAQTVKAAIGENTYHMAERSKLYNEALNVGSKLSEADKSKLSDATNGVDVGKLDDPEQFAKTVDALKKAHDYSLAVDRLGGGKTARFNNGNFSPLYFQASHEAMDSLGIPREEQYDLGDGRSVYVQAGEDSPLTAGKYKGYHNMERQYGSYSDAAQATKGILQPLNANALEDARMYANRGHSTIEGNLLYKQLKKIAPGEVSEDLNQKFGKNGDPLVHAANGQLPFNVSERLNKSLTGYKSSRITNPIGEAAFKAVELPAKGLRKVAFLGAPIHYVNLTRSFLSTTIPSGHGITAIKGVGEALGASLHPKVYAALERAATDSGVREYAGQLGIVDRDTRPNLIGKGTGVKGKITTYSPFDMQMRNLNRFNNVLGWKLAERVRELGIEPGTDDATAIGTEINKVIDRINPKMEGLNPIGERLATSGSLAPHWIRANIGLVKDALVKSVPGIGSGKTGFGLSNAGDIARTNVIGGRILLGAAAILASALATGEMPTLSKAINEAGLNPNNPVPNVEGKSKTKAKYPGGPQYGQVTNLPADPISMAVGLLTDPQHFAVARETPALSAATQAVTNKDYFGNPVVDKSQPGWEKKLAVATAEKLLPFTAQSSTNKTLTTGQKVEAAFGGRTKTDPNDPKYIQNKEHFQGITDAKKGLDAQAARAVDEYTASKKDPQTGSYIAPTVDDQRAKATSLLQNPTAIDSLITMNKKLAASGQKVDPLWSQSKAKIISYLQYQAMPPGGPDQVDWRNKNPWYEQGDNSLYQQRQAFFSSLPPGDPNKPTAPIEYPTPSPAVAQEQATYFKTHDADPASGEQYLLAHPEVQDQMDKQVAYTNQLRQAEGYGALRTYPKPNAHVQQILDAMPTGTDKASKKARFEAYQDPEVAAWSQEDAIYNLTRGGALAEIQGNGLTSKDLSAAYSLSQYDTVKNPDGTYSLKYADPQGGSGPGVIPAQPGAVDTSGGTAFGSAASSIIANYKAANQRREAVRSVKYAGRSKKIIMKSFAQDRRKLSHYTNHNSVQVAKAKPGKLRIKSTAVA